MFLQQYQTPVSGHRISLVQHEKGAPVSRLLYLLDGDAALEALRPEWLAAHRDLLVAAIGYPDTERFNMDRRSQDYTPMPPPEWDGGSRKSLTRPYGGAENFLAALRSEIMPIVEGALAGAVPRRELWGHSYGGLFATWILAQGGSGFDAIHAASPSLWWGDYVLERQLLTTPLPLPVTGRVSLSIGDNEISRTGERLFSPERLEALAGVFRDQGLNCSVSIFPDTGHGPAFARSLELAITGR